MNNTSMPVEMPVEITADVIRNAQPIVMRSTEQLQIARDWRTHVRPDTDTDAGTGAEYLRIVPAVHEAMKKALATVIENHGRDLADLVILKPTMYNIAVATGDPSLRPHAVLLDGAVPRCDEAPHIEIPTAGDIEKYAKSPAEQPPTTPEPEAPLKPFSLISPNDEDMKVYGGSKMPSIMEMPRAGAAQTIIRFGQTIERMEWYMNKANEHLYHFSNMALIDPHSAGMALEEVSEYCKKATELLAVYLRGNERFVADKELNCPHDAAASRIVAEQVESALRHHLTQAVNNRTAMASADMPQEDTQEYAERMDEIDASINQYLQRVSDLLNESRLPHKPTPGIVR